jgi:hypothetical protein
LTSIVIYTVKNTLLEYLEKIVRTLSRPDALEQEVNQNEDMI